MPSGCSARRAATQAHRIVTELEPETGALLARNPWNTEFGGRVALLDLGGRQTSWTADRTEFLGRNGAPDRPAGLERGYHLRSAVGAGLDPCAALQTHVELADGARTQVVVLLGEAADADRGRGPRPARPGHGSRGDASRSRPPLGRHPGHGPGPDAGPRRWTSC